MLVLGNFIVRVIWLGCVVRMPQFGGEVAAERLLFASGMEAVGLGNPVILPQGPSLKDYNDLIKWT